MQDLHIKNMSGLKNVSKNVGSTSNQPEFLSKHQRETCGGKNLVSLASLDCYLVSGFRVKDLFLDAKKP